MKTQLLVLGLLCALLPSHVSAQVPCANCPANGQTVVITLGIYAARTNGTILLPGSPVGSCEPLVVHTDLAYGFGSSGGVISAGYFGGQAKVLAFPGNSTVAESTNDVTPAALATTKIGPVAPAANACGDTDDLSMNHMVYSPTAADLAAGSVKFRFEYSGGTVLLVPCNQQISGSSEISVQLAAPPTCSIAPPSTNASPGSSTTFTAKLTGTDPFTYCWRKGCPGAGACLSVTPTLTISNVQPADAGCYELTTIDTYGCGTTCYGTLIVSPRFTNVTISGSDLIMSGSGGASNGTYTVSTTTNLSVPSPIWLPVGTNHFDASGQFIFTNSIDLSEGKRFFRIGLP